MARKKKENKKLSQLLNLPKILGDGITTEKLDAVYLDLSTLKHQPEPLYRLDFRGQRYYYKFNDGEPQFFTSVTTMIKNTMPTPPQLLKYLVGQGGDEEEANERMAYGTYYHILCGRLLVTGKLDLDNIPTELKEFAIGERIQYKEEWIPELKKDVLAFAQFIIDLQIQPLAVEVILYHPTDGYAGAIDIVAMANIEEKGFYGEQYASGVQKGQPKESKRIVRIPIIIDIKSGKRGFYESYELQLGCYRNMWNIHYPDTPIERIYNWSPKDFRGITPTYNFKEQTNAKSIGKLPHLIELSKIDEGRREHIVLSINGIIDLKNGIGNNIAEKNLSELVKSENK